MHNGSSRPGRPKRRVRFSTLAFACIALGVVTFAVTAAAGYRAVHKMDGLLEARHRDGESVWLVLRTHAAHLQFEARRRDLEGVRPAEMASAYDAARGALERLKQDFSRQVRSFDSPVVRALGTEVDTSLGHRLLLHDERFPVPHLTAQPAAAAGRAVPADDGELAALHDRFDRLGSALIDVAEARSREAREMAVDSSRLVGTLSLFGTAMLLVAVALLLQERRIRAVARGAARRAREQFERHVDQRTEALNAAIVDTQSFAGQLDRHIEAERRRLSREVHDQLGQIITVAKIVVDDLGRTHPAVPAAAIAQITELHDEAIRTIRRIAGELRPPMLDDLGLGAAAEHHVRQAAHIGRLDADVDIHDDASLPPDCANQLFRILQEATTNVLRHAEATRLHVQGRIEGRHYRLDVEDDGRGPQLVRGDASGLRNMRERAALVGGSLQFVPGSHGGSRVTVRVPLEPQTS